MFSRPVVKVARYDNACQLCRIKRRRCVKDEGEVCLLCKKANVPCVFINSTHKTEIPYHKYLEQTISKISSELEQSGSEEEIDGNDENSLLGVPHAATDKFHAQHMVSEIGAVYLRESSSPQSVTDRTGAFSFVDILLSASGIAQEPEDSTSPYPNANVLPTTKVEAEILVSKYQHSIWPLFPIISLQELHLQLENVYNLEAPSSYDLFTVLIIVAITMAAFNDEGGIPSSRLVFKHALRQVRKLVIQSLSGLQSTLLLINYGIFDHESLEVWYLTGTAMRTCMELGLHKDTPSKSRMDRSYVEKRRMLFWSAYSMDRIYSICWGSVLDMAEESIEAVCDSSNERMPGPFLYLIRIRRLQSRCFAGVGDMTCEKEILEELSTWIKSMIDDPDESVKDFRHFLELEYHFCVVLLLRGNPSQIVNSCLEYFKAFKSFKDSKARLTYLVILKLYLICSEILSSAMALKNDKTTLMNAIIASNKCITLIRGLETTFRTDSVLSDRLNRMFENLVKFSFDNTTDIHSIPRLQLPVRRFSK